MRKEIREETKVVRKEVYISNDGLEFATEEACTSWEKSYKGTLELSWNAIPKLKVDSTRLGLPYSSDDHECYMVAPKNLDEIILINAFIEAQDTYLSYSGGEYLTVENIGKFVILDFGYDRDYCDVYTLDAHLQGIMNYTEELKSKLNKSEENKNEADKK